MVQVQLKDLVSHFINKKNSQEKLEIRKLKLKEFDLTIEDLLDLKVSKKIKKFEEI